MVVSPFMAECVGLF